MTDIFDTRFEGKEIELGDNKILLGEDLNLTAKDPTLKKVHIGVGWDLNVFDSDVLDLDVSLFMVDKNGQTRVDEDFVFYNNMETLNGGVKHNGDSRTGAGKGDDESFTIDLHAVPFDIVQLLFSLTIYKGEEKEQRLGQVRNAYIRVLNAETMHEITRYEMDADLEDKEYTAMIVAVLNREGPKWHFRPVCEFVDGGMRTLAQRYGLIIMQQ